MQVSFAEYKPVSYNYLPKNNQKNIAFKANHQYSWDDFVRYNNLQENPSYLSFKKLENSDLLPQKIKDIESQITEYNTPLFNTLMQRDAHKKTDLFSLLDSTHKYNVKVLEKLANDPSYPVSEIEDVGYILNVSECIDKEYGVISVAKKIINNRNLPNLMIRSALLNRQAFEKVMILPNLKEDLKTVDNTYKTVCAHPERFINGVLNPAETQHEIDNFFSINYCSLALLAEYLDKDAFNELLRTRLHNAEKYLEITEDFSQKNLNLLKNLNKCVNPEGKPFTPKQKVEFIDLIESYKSYKLSLNRIETMAKSGTVDFNGLQTHLLIAMLKESGVDSKTLKDFQNKDLQLWEPKYLLWLAKQYKKEKIGNQTDKNMLNDLIRAIVTNNFDNLIYDSKTPYGKANLKTKKQFKKYGIDYDKWLKPAKTNNVIFKKEDISGQKLLEISSEISKNISTLMENDGARLQLEKSFRECIKDDKFVIPQRYLRNKDTLKFFTDNFINQTDKIWQRASESAQSDDFRRFQNGNKTLQILKNLKKLKQSLDEIENNNLSKPLDLTIRMWERNPKKDLFQGNYSDCCVGMGHSRGNIMPYYLLNTAFNMIEIYDNNEKEIIGNALCYFEKREDNTPVLMIDNIEINPKMNISKDTGRELRQHIVMYMDNVAKETTGREDIDIFIGNHINDVPCYDMPNRSEYLEFLGGISLDDEKDIYLDAYNGKTYKSDLEMNQLEFCKPNKTYTVED